jgi:hypothetical protein
MVRALVQILYKHHGAIYFGGRGDKRAQATENLFQHLLLPPLFASCLVDYLETEIQKQSAHLKEVPRRAVPVAGDVESGHTEATHPQRVGSWLPEKSVAPFLG